ncbi:hypothetical protein [Conexibacter woesei]|uniref:DUF11 domain-containing protein n=1 Tax=Conexibacter woesei (strain DSM 14684 / CCUG 47730 / CIP 108061 / JCM 11494 / NBRC 100937 / ID131577) TaxID=469383 RepID=D3FB91_CONWI|nr:hypothetical protein [Conexibacter woesei]ADB53283.1 hypothetical protein Cwoe_4871 [Conexibacter woesei DSM 14684]
MRAAVRLLALGLALLLAHTGSAVAATPSAGWEIGSTALPSTFAPGDTGAQYRILAKNAGAAATDGSAVQVRAVLPAGVTVTAIVGDADYVGTTWTCDVATLTCDLVPGFNGPAVKAGQVLPPILLTVTVDAGLSGDVVSGATIEGGGTPAVSTATTTPVGFAPVPFGVRDGSFRAEVVDEAGRAVSELQAGEHPFSVVVGLAVPAARFDDGNGGSYAAPADTVRNVQVRMPAGFYGSTRTAAKCTNDQLALTLGQGAGCPAGSQVGTVDLTLFNGTSLYSWADSQQIAVYNMVPPKGVVADFAFALIGNPVHVRIELDPDDHSLVATIPNVTERFPVLDQRLTLWGTPGDPLHDAERFNPADPFGGLPLPFPGDASPFLTLPSRCGQLDGASVSVSSWGAPGRVSSARTAARTVKGCERQRFGASIGLGMDTTRADAPSGISVRVDVDQQTGWRGLATPPLKDVAVALPEGVSVSPSSADGLAGCFPDQIRLGTDAEPACPDASRIGSVEIATPLLDEPLRGGVFLAQPRANPFGSLIAFYVVAQGSGVTLKLPSRVTTDLATGRVTTTFEQLPQLPFSTFRVRFKGGQRGLLATAPTCGTAAASARLTPWNGSLPAIVIEQPMTTDADGAGGACGASRFEPAFRAGTADATAGRTSPFALAVARPDQHEQLEAISTELPAGLTGRIAAATLCADAAAARGTCPVAAQVGSVQVGSGPGASPLFLDGKVYVTGPYRGGAFGLSVAVPAVAGPFDLGTVVVRAAIFVDPLTTRLRIVSDPFPASLEGIPLRIRDVRLAVDRPGFMLNPTNCSPASVAGQLRSTRGRIATVASRFQVGDCGALRFRPRMTLRAGSRRHRRGGDSTPLEVVLAMSPGQANVRSVSVTLPRTLSARLQVLNTRNACTLQQFRSDSCPIDVGSAVAVTPLLRDPLVGRVALVRNRASRLPDVMVALRGQGDARAVRVELAGKIAITRALQIRTTFAAAPDAPISKFRLSFAAGRHAAIAASENLCSARARRRSIAQLTFVAQNGRRVARDQRIAIAGCRR